MRNDARAVKFADPQQDRSANKQRHPTRHASCDAPSGDKGLRETGCHDHYKRDSGEGKAESDLGIFRLAYEHTGSRREEDEVGAHTGAKADSVNPKAGLAKIGKTDRRVLT